jgi:hypothetical protein
VQPCMQQIEHLAVGHAWTTPPRPPAPGVSEEVGECLYGCIPEAKGEATSPMGHERR